MPKIAKPSVEAILDLYTATKSRYTSSGIIEQWEDDEALYELDFLSELLLPTEFASEGTILPTARDLVDTCTDQTDISNVRVWVNRKGESTKAEEEQELLRKFGLGIIYRNNIEANIAPLRVAAKHYWMHGQTIIKTVWDADRWLDRPEQKTGESEESYAARIDEWRSTHHDSIPIVMQAVHPKNIMLDPFYDGGMFVFETRKELCFNVENMFPGWTNPDKKKVSDTVEHISFWTKDFRCELYDKEPVLKTLVAKHTYGFIPYVSIDSGLGNLTSDNDLKKRYVGILRYIRDILISESRDYSVGDIILKKSAFPWGYLKGKNTGAVTKIDQKFGSYTPLPDDVEIVDMAPKVPPDALLTWLGVASSYLSSHAAPNSIRGMGEKGVRSGTDRQQIIAAASTRYQYSNEAFKNGVAKVLSNCARIMKNVVPGDINVWARTPTDEFDIVIKKDKIHEPFTFYVEFSSQNEEDEYRRHDDLERLYKSGLVTKKWARKQMSNVDPIALELEEEVEKLINDPMIQQIQAQVLAGKLMEVMAKQQAAKDAKNSVTSPPGMPMPGIQTAPQGMPITGGEPGRQMSPQPPNIAPLGSGQDLQNKLALLRSQSSMTQQGKGGGGS